MNDMTRFLTGCDGLILFAIVLAEQIGLPLPAAPWLLAAGALLAHGELNPALVMAVTVVAVLVADSLWFWRGRRSGSRVLGLLRRLSFSANPSIPRAKKVFARHGLGILAVAKFFPGLSTAMPPLAGALGMGTVRFLVFDSLGAFIYGSFYLGAGFLFHNQIQEVMNVLDHLGLDTVLVIVALVGGYAVVKYFRQRNARTKRTRQKDGPNKETRLVGGGAKVFTGRPNPDALNLTAHSLEVPMPFPLQSSATSNESFPEQ